MKFEALNQADKKHLKPGYKYLCMARWHYAVVEYDHKAARVLAFMDKCNRDLLDKAINNDERRGDAIKPEQLRHWVTLAEIEKGILGEYKKTDIQRGIRTLQILGFLKQEKIPNPDFRRKPYCYTLNITKIQKAVDVLAAKGLSQGYNLGFEYD